MKTFPLLIAMMGLALITVSGVCFVAITLLREESSARGKSSLLWTCG